MCHTKIYIWFMGFKNIGPAVMDLGFDNCFPGSKLRFLAKSQKGKDIERNFKFQIPST